MITTTSPRATSRLTSSSTWRRPKYLWMWLILTTELEPPLRVERQTGEGIADGEVERRHDAEHLERQEGLLHQDLAGPGQLHVAQHRHDRGVLDEPDEEPDPRRDHDPQRLGQDDPPHDLHVAHAEAPGRFPLVPPDRLDPRAHDLGHERAGVDHEGGNPGPEHRHLHLEEDRQREENDVELHQNRRVTDHLDVRGRRNPEPWPLRSAGETDHEGDHGPQYETENAEAHRVPQPLREQERVPPVELVLDEVRDVAHVRPPAGTSAGPEA